MRHHLLIAISLIGLSGCATSRGFNRDELRKEINEGPMASELRAQLPGPFKVGIIFKDPRVRNGADTAWQWSDEDRRKIREVFDPYLKSGKISSVTDLRIEGAAKTDPQSLRRDAAKANVDAVLIVSAVKDADKYENQYAWSYFALAPMLVVPGSETDVLFMTRATMWDVKTPYLYMTANAESMHGQTRPLAFTHERELTDTSKDEALSGLAIQISKNLAELSGRKNGGF